MAASWFFPALEGGVPPTKEPDDAEVPGLKIRAARRRARSAQAILDDPAGNGAVGELAHGSTTRDVGREYACPFAHGRGGNFPVAGVRNEDGIGHGTRVSVAGREPMDPPSAWRVPLRQRRDPGDSRCATPCLEVFAEGRWTATSASKWDERDDVHGVSIGRREASGGCG